MLELPGLCFFPATWDHKKYASTDLAGFLILFSVNKKVQIQVWALVLDEVILAKVNGSQCFWPADWCDLKLQSIYLLLIF